jgi:acyl-CoA synthetase (AMP-forming)/AMP-acid ligase II
VSTDSVAFLLQRFQEQPDGDAIIWRDQVTSYRQLGEEFTRRRRELGASGVGPHAVVSIEADFSPAGAAVFLAAASLGSTLVPLTDSVSDKKGRFLNIAQVTHRIMIDGSDTLRIIPIAREVDHPLHLKLQDLGHPGLVLFSSGSTGESKAALHDLAMILRKYETRRHAQRTVAFLLYDHIGGVNTMLHVLSNLGCIVTVENRSPDAVLATVAKHRVEVLPTSPTFINMILLSGAHKLHDLSCLKLITYGTESMTESTLRRLHAEMPGVRLLQTYGLSEVGILRSKSRSDDSLWVRMGGEGFETRVVEGLLEIKAASAMLGYLNAPSPFTEDGWFKTNDQVEVDGEWLKILGRKSEIINVGGEKAFPAEIEAVIQEVENVADVAVYGEKSAITGMIVCADVVLKAPEAAGVAIARIRSECAIRLQKYMRPVKLRVIDGDLHGDRFKKLRPVRG